jgi:glycosyltransferase involved in cell wall biosynthesis
MLTSPFNTTKRSVPDNCQIVFVSDFFANQLIGGAELTSQALIDSSPYSVYCINSEHVTPEFVDSAINKFWIIGNWSALNWHTIQKFVTSKNLNYSIIEYDYKYCMYRSPEKHKATSGVTCNCETSQVGKLVEVFYSNAAFIWWMSEKQRYKFVKALPVLEKVPQLVLSSVFDEYFWETISSLKNTPKNKKWLVLGSSSWVKGTDSAVTYCVNNGLEYEVLTNLQPQQMLQKFAEAEGFIYLPKGGDTCPRVVIEAKLLGCKLHINENVEHAQEDWFNTDDLKITESYLRAAKEHFWNTIKSIIEWKPTISGYTTVRNCIEMQYPWENTIQSMLGFCDEVVVLDGGSTDGTWEKLQEIAKTDSRIVAKQFVRDWTTKRFAVFDGAQKAEARNLCTKKFCWQMDSDEILPESDWQKVKNFCKVFPRDVDIVCFPVVEYWGSVNRTRVDVNPWKWRLSRNKPNITHGIPAYLRAYDENGELYAKIGTDGCDYVTKDSGEIVPYSSFYNQNVHNARITAVAGNKEALTAYEKWFRTAITELPSVRHFSWVDMERKIRNYRDFWQKFWESLYNVKHEDTAQNNMFFDKPWAEVTEDEIKNLAYRLSNETGGHVFHTKVNLNKPTPYLSIR